MQKAGLAIVIALGLIAGLLWPTGLEADAQRSPGNQFIEVVLDESSDGHFYADAEINGETVRFLVDTGSSAVALTEKDARRAGIAFEPARFELLGEGASGFVRGQQVSLAKLNIGEIEATGVKAAVVEGATVSLLGLPFLDEIDEIVIRKGEMSLRKHR